MQTSPIICILFQILHYVRIEEVKAIRADFDILIHTGCHRKNAEFLNSHSWSLIFVPYSIGITKEILHQLVQNHNGLSQT